MFLKSGFKSLCFYSPNFPHLSKIWVRFKGKVIYNEKEGLLYRTDK